MNYIILYDGSFNNLLITIKYLFTNNIKPINIVKEDNFKGSLTEYPFKPEINEFDKLNIPDKNIFKIIYYIYLSNNKNKELVIYFFLLNYYVYKNDILKHRNLKCVNMALAISHKVSREAHLLKGFTRFKLINNEYLYAKIKPVNDILELLSGHFAKRLKNEYWIIEDEGRNIVSIYNKDKFYIIDRCDIKLNLDNTDNVWEDLWIVFFKTISIKSRENKRCQMSFMPKKYWQNIIEMESIYEECN